MRGYILWFCVMPAMWQLIIILLQSALSEGVIFFIADFMWVFSDLLMPIDMWLFIMPSIPSIFMPFLPSAMHI